MWQAVHEELSPRGLTVITVALDENAESARPWIEKARTTHPSLIDTDHVLADRYNLVNVPSSVWIDETGRIARPRDVAFGDDRFRDFTRVASAPHIDALRAWVIDNRVPFTADELRRLVPLPTGSDQLARAEFALAVWLSRQGRTEAAERHFERAGELAPHDFTIRRGSLPIRGISPRGEEFRRMHGDWEAAGRPYYEPLDPLVREPPEPRER